LFQHRTDSVSNVLPAWARLGSLSLKASLATRPQTNGSSRLFPPRRLTQRGGLAVSRLDGRGISLEDGLLARLVPGPAPRIARLTRPGFPAAAACAGSDVPRQVEDFLLALRHTTGGDDNPHRSWAFAPISLGWPRRWPPVPPRPFFFFARTFFRNRAPFSGAFSCFARSHGGTVLAVTGPDLSSEASSPGSDAPCRERRAGRGADTPAIFIVSRRHPYHGDGTGFWPIVGPALRV
jgi:hypothetical protein